MRWVSLTLRCGPLLVLQWWLLHRHHHCNATAPPLLWLIIVGAAAALVVAAIAAWAASHPTWRTPFPRKVEASEQKEERKGEVPLEPANHFLALPDDVLALVLLQPLFRAIDIQAQQQDVLRAGACCKAFAACVREASATIAARHGWRLPPDGIALMRHLSKVEQDTKWVRSILRDDSSFWWSAGIDSESASGLLEFVSCWNQEASLGFVGPLLIYPEVRRQHIPELSRLLIELAMSVCRKDPNRNAKISRFLRPLVGIMAQPGTPLDTHWLAPRVFLLVKKHMNVNGFCGESYELQCVQETQIALIDLLGFLEPHVLRSDPETFKWLIATLQDMPKTRVTASGEASTVENFQVNDTMWNTGLAAWNERCEAQRLQLRSSGAEGHDVPLDAILHKQIRGCFASCGWSNAQQLQPDLQQMQPRAPWQPPRPWSSCHGAWWSVTSHDIFHAVYHDSPVGRVQRPEYYPFVFFDNYYPFFFHLYFYHHYVHLPLLRLLHRHRGRQTSWHRLRALLLALCFTTPIRRRVA